MYELSWEYGIPMTIGTFITVIVIMVMNTPGAPWVVLLYSLP